MEIEENDLYDYFNRFLPETFDNIESDFKHLVGL